MGTYTLRVEGLQQGLALANMLQLCGITGTSVREDCQEAIYPLDPTTYVTLTECVDRVAGATATTPIVSSWARLVQPLVRQARGRDSVTLSLCGGTDAPVAPVVAVDPEAMRILRQFGLHGVAEQPAAALHGTIVGFAGSSEASTLAIVYADVHMQSVHDEVASGFSTLFMAGVPAVGLEGLPREESYPTCAAYRQDEAVRQWSYGLMHAIDLACIDQQRVFGIEDAALHRQGYRLARRVHNTPIGRECFMHNAEARSGAAAENFLRGLGSDRIGNMLIGMYHIATVTEVFRRHAEVAYLIVLPQPMAVDDYVDILLESRELRKHPEPAVCRGL